MARRRTLSGRVAAITGGARGIGRATASALVREGVKVAIGDIDVDAARDTATALGGDTLALQLDVAERASCERFVDEAEQQLGPLDVLVNNAGIVHFGQFLDEDDALTRRMVEVNALGVVNGMKVVLPRMRARGAGHVVNVASSAGHYGIPGVVTYCATKFFVRGLSEAVRAELRGTGVEISCVMPLAVHTDLTAGMRVPRFPPVLDPPDVAEAIVRALRSPRFDVFVPRSLGRANPALGLLPRRTREAVARLLAARLETEDEALRSAYTARVFGAGTD